MVAQIANIDPVELVEPLKRTYTPDEYLTLEVETEERNEYRNGEIFPMSGGTPNHSTIAGNFYAILWILLGNEPYRVFNSDQRLWIPDTAIHTYPDVMVLSEPIMRLNGRTDTLINPVLIAEVLSKSTRNYDQGDKFTAYRSILSFTEYLLIDQYKIHVEHRVRTAANQWTLTTHTEPTAKLRLTSLVTQKPLEILVQDLYKKVVFESPA
jgi:Uma2 family endonuclease